MIKELWYLIKALFNPLTDQIEVIKMKYFPFPGYSAMSWCGKIITKRDKVSDKDVNHEKIHLEQALQIAKQENTNTWLTYYWQYLKYWIKGNPFSESAYYTIPFEMEAYGNEHDFTYKVTKDSWKKYEIKDIKGIYKKHRDNWQEFCKNLV